MQVYGPWCGWPPNGGSGGILGKSWTETWMGQVSIGSGIYHRSWLIGRQIIPTRIWRSWVWFLAGSHFFFSIECMLWIRLQDIQELKRISETDVISECYSLGLQTVVIGSINCSLSVIGGKALSCETKERITSLWKNEVHSKFSACIIKESFSEKSLLRYTSCVLCLKSLKIWNVNTNARCGCWILVHSYRHLLTLGACAGGGITVVSLCLPVYMLLKMFYIQLEGHTYWFYAKINNFQLIDFCKTASFKS